MRNLQTSNQNINFFLITKFLFEKALWMPPVKSLTAACSVDDHAESFDFNSSFICISKRIYIYFPQGLKVLLFKTNFSENYTYVSLMVKTSPLEFLTRTKTPKKQQMNLPTNFYFFFKFKKSPSQLNNSLCVSVSLSGIMQI